MLSWQAETGKIQIAGHHERFEQHSLWVPYAGSLPRVVKAKPARSIPGVRLRQNLTIIQPSHQSHAPVDL
jgi:hypothetical protein